MDRVLDKSKVDGIFHSCNSLDLYIGYSGTISRPRVFK